jgi:hypothetical protein
MPEWKKGVSGNPKGRPKKSITIPHLIRKYGQLKAKAAALDLIKKYLDIPEEMNAMETAVARTIVGAMNGEAWAMHFIAERTEGKVAENAPTEEQEPVVFFYGRKRD